MTIYILLSIPTVLLLGIHLVISRILKFLGLDKSTNIEHNANPSLN